MDPDFEDAWFERMESNREDLEHQRYELESVNDESE